MVKLGRIRSKTPPPSRHDGQNNMILDATPSRVHSFGRRTNANDNMSYITDVSSVTCPTELAMDRSNSIESADDADVSFFSMTEVNSALTGWTSVDNKSNPTAAKEKDVIDKGKKLAPINENKANVDELSIILDSSDDGSVEVQSITDKLKSMNADNWNPRPMSIDATRGKNDKTTNPKTPASPKPPLPPSPRTTVHGNKAVQFQSPSNAKGASLDNHTEKDRPTSPKSVLKTKTPGPVTNKPNVPQSPTASISSIHKKRQPVPPLKDPSMDDNEDDEDATWEADCNYDINPTLMFQMLESGDWRTCIEFLDGKSSRDVWNLTALIGIGAGAGKKPDVKEMKARQKELRSQARTWIVRREKSGVLRWRMLPIHAALVFNAPFDVVLRLYHLYPGAIRCRNDLGMLPLHHVFMYGNEDRILELFLDVFPEALSVVDDKGRLPLGCTPQDGSDNERRSNILDLYSKFQVEFAKKLLEEETENAAKTKGGNKARNIRNQPQIKQNTAVSGPPQGSSQQMNNQQRQPMQQLHRSPDAVSSLGIAPRYTTATGFNHVPYEAMMAHSKISKDPTTALRPIKASRREIDDDKSLPDIDRYVSSDESLSENSSNIANLHKERVHLRSELLKLGGLDTIQENGPDEKGGSGAKKVKKGLLKMFKKRSSALASI